MKKKNLIKLFLLTFLFFAVEMEAQKDSLWTIDQLSYMTVYLMQKNEKTSSSGTGNIISYKKKFFLLTATHVAKEMNNDPVVIFKISGDKPAILKLKDITIKNQLNWLNHIEADISIIELSSTNNDVIKRFNDWSFSSDFIYNGSQTIARDNDLTFFGFPILDFELKHFSPLSFTAYPASGFLTNKRYDTGQKCTFLYLDQPSMQGCSGSAVYCSVKKNSIYMGMEKTLMLGVVHGTAKDDTGGKLAAICPSFYIWDLLKQTDK